MNFLKEFLKKAKKAKRFALEGVWLKILTTQFEDLSQEGAQYIFLQI